MTACSDLDLLVLKERKADDKEVRFERWTTDDGTEEIDVVVMDHAKAEAGRRSATRLEGIALEEGRTVYLREGGMEIPTGPCYSWDGTTMVKTSKFDPDDAANLVKYATETWKSGLKCEETPRVACRLLHETMELSLKGLIAAHGKRFPHTRDLNELWNLAEKAGGPIPVGRDVEK